MKGNKHMSEEKYLKIAEASKQFDVSRTHIYNRVKAGKIRTIGEDGTLQVNEMDVHNYVLGLKRRVKKSKKQKKTANISIEGYVETNAKKRVKKTELPVVEIVAVITGGVVGFIVAYLLF